MTSAGANPALVFRFLTLTDRILMMIKQNTMRQLFACTLVQCAIVLLLVVTGPSDLSNKNKSSGTQTSVLDTLQQLDPLSGRPHSFPGATSTAIRGPHNAPQSSWSSLPRIAFARQAPVDREIDIKVANAHQSRNHSITEVSQSEPLAPTLDQVEQTLSVPLAFFEPPAEAELTAAQRADVASVATQFVNSVAGATQDPADLAYAERYDAARILADEEIWAVSGQDAYTALINARAQAAGNPTPDP